MAKPSGIKQEDHQPLFDDDDEDNNGDDQQRKNVTPQAATNSTTTATASSSPSSSSSPIPPEASDLVKNLFKANPQFRTFLQRQVENRKEYAFDDKTNQFSSEAATHGGEEEMAGGSQQQLEDIDGSSSLSASPLLPAVYKARGKVTHLIFRSTHWYWFDLARADFVARQQKATSERTSVAFIAIITAAVCFLLWVRWPLWDFLVAIQANEHYRVLGLEPGATLPEINRAYRDMTKKVHPDRNPGCGQRCVTKMMDVKKAYEVLKGKDEASELQNQIDQMFGQIVMFTFGDIFAMAIQTGIVLTAFLYKLFYGSLESIATTTTTTTKSEGGLWKKYVPSIVGALEYAIRGLLLLTGIGFVLFTSDRNPLSLIAIVYAVVQHVSVNTSESIEEVFRFRGLQLRDMLLSVAVFLLPALAADVGPTIIQQVLFFSSSAASGGGGDQQDSFSDAFGDSGQNKSAEDVLWAVLVASLGMSYVVSAIFVAPPSFLDNRVMFRAVAPIDMCTVVGTQSGGGGGGGGADREEVTVVGVSTRSKLSFFVMTILKRDVLAFGLKIPAVYRLAAFAVYGCVFLQMLWYPTEIPIFFDSKFRKAEEDAKRRAIMRRRRDEAEKSGLLPKHQQQKQKQQDGNGNNSCWIPPALELGAFDFLTNDAPGQPRVHMLKMNDNERQLCSHIDNEVPFWQELLRFDDNTSCRPQEIASTEKFEKVLCEVSRRDYGLAMTRMGNNRVKATMIFASQLSKSDDPHAMELYGNYRMRQTSRDVADKIDAVLDEQLGGLASALGFWAVVGSVVVALALSSHVPAARVAATKVFSGQLAAASVADMRERMRESNTFFDCDDEAFRSGRRNQRRVGRTMEAKMCRPILAQDTHTRMEKMQTVNIFMQLEGFNPLKVIGDEDFERRQAQIVLHESEVNKKRQQQNKKRSSSGKQQKGKKRFNAKTGQEEEVPSSNAGAQEEDDEDDAFHFHKRASHDLTQKRRSEEQARAEAEAAADPGHVPMFGGQGGPGGGPKPPSQEDMEKFMKFAQELERRQRSRGWRPRPEYDPANMHRRQQQAANKARAARNAKRISSGGSGSSASSGAVVMTKEEQDAEEAEMRLAEQEAAAKPVQTMQQYQQKMFYKMQKWIHEEVQAGRLHLDWNGQVIEQDQNSLIEWMMENDDTWEPDPNAAGGNPQQRLGGGNSASEELRRLRGGNSAPTRKARKTKNQR